MFSTLLCRVRDFFGLGIKYSSLEVRVQLIMLQLVQRFGFLRVGRGL